MISAKKGEFETGVSSEGGTKEHALLAFTMGIKQLIVAVNKMDADSVLYSEKRYQEIKKEAAAFLKKIGFNPEKVPFVPISGWAGDNIIDKSANMEWYKGPTLVDALDNVVPPKRPVDKPLRIPIQDVFKIDSIGTVGAGRVESGSINPGMNIKIAPSGFVGEVRSVEMHHTQMACANPGDNIGFSARGLTREAIKKGYVVGNVAQDPPMEAQEFVAQIIVLNHPNMIRNGYTPVLDIHTTHVACRFEEITEKIERRTGQTKEKNPEGLKNGDSGLVRLIPTKPLVVEKYSDFPPLGRFAVRDMKQTVAVGVIKEVVKKELKNGGKKEPKAKGPAKKK